MLFGRCANAPSAPSAVRRQNPSSSPSIPSLVGGRHEVQRRVELDHALRSLGAQHGDELAREFKGLLRGRPCIWGTIFAKGRCNLLCMRSCATTSTSLARLGFSAFLAPALGASAEAATGPPHESGALLALKPARQTACCSAMAAACTRPTGRSRFEPKQPSDREHAHYDSNARQLFNMMTEHTCR